MSRDTLRRAGRNAAAARLRPRGFTIVECAMSVMIVGSMLVVGLTLVGSAAKSRVTHSELRRADRLAAGLMAEIVQRRYADPGGGSVLGLDAGESTARTTWDDVDDYNGLNESPPLDRAGAAIPGYTGWTQAVRTKLDSPVAAELDVLSVGTDRGLKRISVTVTSPRGAKRILRGLRSRWGTGEMTPPGGQSVRTMLNVALRPAEGDPPLWAAAELLNTPPQ